MTDSSTNDGVTLAPIADKIAALEEESDALRAAATSLQLEIEELRALVRARGISPAAPPLDEVATLSPNVRPEDAAAQSHPVSRRGALRALGGAAAGGVGLAIGSAFLGADPAAAAGNVTLGAQNNETATTNFTNSTDQSNALTGVAVSNAAGVHGVLGGASGLGPISAGVVGETNGDSPGVLGLCSGDGTAVFAQASSFSTGVVSQADKGIAILATTNQLDEPAIVAANNGDGPTLRLSAGGATLPGNSSPGSFIVLGNNSLWYAHDLGQWTQLNKGFTNLLASPIRVFDSRTSGNPADPGRAAGEVGANSITTLQITGVTVNALSVPAGAAAVVGNVTIDEPTGDGYLTLYPAAAGTPPNISNLNYQVGDSARANFCVVALSASGQLDVYARAQTHLIFDVTGYIL